VTPELLFITHNLGSALSVVALLDSQLIFKYIGSLPSLLSSGGC
jgi:hypothetical protein